MDPEQPGSPVLTGLRRAISLEDRLVFDKAFGLLGERTSDMTFAACYLWAEPLGLSWAEVEGHLCVFSADGDELGLILPPMALEVGARGRLGACVDECFAIMDSYNRGRGGVVRSRIEYADDESVERLLAVGGGALSFEPLYFDYVYPSSAMIDLAGGDLKSKRKLRSGFIRENPDGVLVEMREEDVEACVALLERWRCAGDESHEGEANDQLVGSDVLRKHDEVFTVEALRRFRKLGLDAMVLWAGGRIIGFTMGERLSERMAAIHIEKVEPGVRGAAQFIFSEFCRLKYADCAEINVGDDWGIPSLRFTKTSYRPTRLMAKSVVTRGPVVVTGGEPSVVKAMDDPERARIEPARRAEVEIVLRAAVSGDAVAICRIEGEAFEDVSERFNLRQAKRLIANCRAGVTVAEVGGEVVGWAVTLTRRTNGSGRARSGRLYAIAVSGEWKGRGIGKRLARHAVDGLDAMGIGRVYLEVRDDNERAIGLYRSLGFDVIAALPGYYGGRKSAVRMRRVNQGTQVDCLWESNEATG